MSFADCSQQGVFPMPLSILRLNAAGLLEKAFCNLIILDIGAFIPAMTLSYVIAQPLFAKIEQWYVSWHQLRNLSANTESCSEGQSAIEEKSARSQDSREEVSFADAVAARACHAALRISPAACRDALATHRARIDPALSKTLEIVGGYEEDKVASIFQFVVTGVI